MTMSITMGVLACKRYHGQSCIIIEDVWKSNYFLVQPLNKAAHEHCCQLSRNIGMEVIPKTILLVRNSTNSVSIDVDLTPMGGKCDNGHIVCSTCCDKLGNKCPKCNISSKRCKAIENILQSMEEISCPNEKHGCRETISYCRNRKHEKECIYELCYCPFSGCDFVASSEVLSSHFIQKHGDSRNKFSYDHSFIVSLNSNDETVVLQEKNDGQLFILKNITMLLGNAVNVCCIGPKSSESRYSYNILACSKMSKLEFHTFVKNVQQVTLKTLSSKFLVIPFGFSEPLEIEICIRSLPCDSMMQIFIKKLDGKVLPLRVKSSDTIYSVKEKIFNKEKYAIIDQRLIFSGNQLPDDQTIANCNIEEKSAIFLVFRLMGD